MQRSLSKLDVYCKQWKLCVNSQKSKIMIFRQRKIAPKVQFIVARSVLEVVDSFTYLGITFTYNGNFHQAIKNMQTKAMRALYKISCSLNSGDVRNCNLFIKLFDAMVKPILLCGCQVWSQRLLKYFLSHDFGNLSRLPFEQLHHKLCRQALGLGKYSSSIAIRAELGRFPLLLNIALLTIRYWLSILKSPSKLVNAAYQEDLELEMNGQKNWVTLVRVILRRCDVPFEQALSSVQKPD